MIEASHLRSAVNADGAVILNTRTGRVITLNPAGADVWMAIQRGEDFESIVASLVQVTDADQDSVRKDIHELLESLSEHDLIPSAILGRNL